MASGKKSFSFPGTGWIGSRLSRKIIAALLILGLVNWVLSGFSFLSSLKGYAEDFYDETVYDASELARRTAAFLEGSRGDCSQLESYLAENNIDCTIWSDSGDILYAINSSAEKEAGVAASASAYADIGGGKTITVDISMPYLDRDYLMSGLAHKAYMGLLAFNAAIVLGAGILFYVIFLSPMISLRKTIEDYSNTGALPPRSTRIDEIGKLQNTFTDLTSVLKAKEQSEHRLIASISHDIKTPLTSILGYSQRLMTANLTDEKKTSYISSIHDKGIAIKSIVDEFDEYLDAGLRDSSPMDLVSAGSLCRIIQEEYQSELMDADVTLNISCTCPDARLFCRTDHIKRYFGNLIVNSINHGETKKLVLNISCRQEDREIIFDFSDNGCGVPDNLLNDIFEPLYTTDRGRKVSGLGLSICRSIISAHGGKVTASNLPGSGLLVSASIPAART